MALCHPSTRLLQIYIRYTYMYDMYMYMCTRRGICVSPCRLSLSCSAWLRPGAAMCPACTSCRPRAVRSTPVACNHHDSTIHFALPGMLALCLLTLCQQVPAPQQPFTNSRAAESPSTASESVQSTTIAALQLLLQHSSAATPGISALREVCMQRLMSGQASPVS